MSPLLCQLAASIEKKISTSQERPKILWALLQADSLFARLF